MSDTLLLIVGMATVTYIPRFLPLMLLSSRSMPDMVTRWLELIPAAVLSALLAPSLLLVKNGNSFRLDISQDNIFLLAAIPAFLTAWLTKSFFGTVLAGMGSLAFLRFWLA